MTGRNIMRCMSVPRQPPQALPRRSGLATLFLGGLLALALPLLLTACRGGPDAGDPSLVLDLAISPTPPAVGPARLIIHLRDTDGVPLEGAEIQVEGNMSHAGMVPVLATAEEEGSGLYSVTDFRFTMAGDWILTTRATLPDGRWAQSITTTRAVAAPPGLEPDTAHEGHEHGPDHSHGEAPGAPQAGPAPEPQHQQGEGHGTPPASPGYAP